MESKKYNKLVNKAKYKQSKRYREQTLVTTLRRGNIGVERWELQTTGCETWLRMQCTTQGR